MELFKKLSSDANKGIESDLHQKGCCVKVFGNGLLFGSRTGISLTIADGIREFGHVLLFGADIRGLGSGRKIDGGIRRRSKRWQGSTSFAG